MIVRGACIVEAEVLAALHALGVDAPWSAADLAALMADPGTLALIAAEENAPAGFILIRCVADEAEVLTLVTAPAHRRRGVARTLVRAAAKAAEALGAETVFLEAARDNTAALALYRGEGFAEVGVRRGYYARASGNVDALVLRQSLNR